MAEASLPAYTNMPHRYSLDDDIESCTSRSSSSVIIWLALLSGSKFILQPQTTGANHDNPRKIIPSHCPRSLANPSARRSSFERDHRDARMAPRSKGDASDSNSSSSSETKPKVVTRSIFILSLAGKLC